MTLQQLIYATKIAEKGSMSKAAEELYIAQPSLSSQIQALEEEFNIKIFERNNKGVITTDEGKLFLTYAKEVLSQAKMLDERFKEKNDKILFQVSCQHYSFAVNAFVDVIKEFGKDNYTFKLRETKTYEILDDVSNFDSEMGIIYVSDFNKKIIKKILEDKNLEYEFLFEVKPHVFISNNSSLANKDIISLEDLDEHPYLSFEQKDHDSSYYEEELIHINPKKKIKVSDRATLFNFLIALDGYTISSGVIDEKLNQGIISRPLDDNTNIHIVIIKRKNTILSKIGQYYLESLKKYIN